LFIWFGYIYYSSLLNMLEIISRSMQPIRSGKIGYPRFGVQVYLTRQQPNRARTISTLVYTRKQAR
jgi:hypothetical protein